ncbi:hypothetical protein DFH27DRAFT_616958 [Peziza echinospora]|nr:hypothetical protein DFH27DRAFT_616958 [Peziza echinospora]
MAEKTSNKTRPEYRQESEFKVTIVSDEPNGEQGSESGTNGKHEQIPQRDVHEYWQGIHPPSRVSKPTQREIPTRSGPNQLARGQVPDFREHTWGRADEGGVLDTAAVEGVRWLRTQNPPDPTKVTTQPEGHQDGDPYKQKDSTIHMPSGNMERKSDGTGRNRGHSISENNPNTHGDDCTSDGARVRRQWYPLSNKKKRLFP